LKNIFCPPSLHQFILKENDEIIRMHLSNLAIARRERLKNNRVTLLDEKLYSAFSLL